MSFAHTHQNTPIGEDNTVHNLSRKVAQKLPTEETKNILGWADF